MRAVGLAFRGVLMRIIAVLGLMFVAATFASPVQAAPRNDAAPRHDGEAVRVSSDLSAQSTRHRRVPRVRVYRSLGPNSVRVCNAYYVQEYRASGTVIVPRMNCYWRG